MHQADVLLYCCVVGGSHNTCDNTHNRFYSILFGTICISVSMWASRIAYSRLTKVLSAYELLLFLSSIFLCAPFDLHRSQHGSGCIGQKQILWVGFWVSVIQAACLEITAALLLYSLLGIDLRQYMRAIEGTSDRDRDACDGDSLHKMEHSFPFPVIWASSSELLCRLCCRLIIKLITIFAPILMTVNIHTCTCGMWTHPKDCRYHLNVKSPDGDGSFVPDGATEE